MQCRTHMLLLFIVVCHFSYLYRCRYLYFCFVYQAAIRASNTNVIVWFAQRKSHTMYYFGVSSGIACNTEHRAYSFVHAQTFWQAFWYFSLSSLHPMLWPLFIGKSSCVSCGNRRKWVSKNAYKQHIPASGGLPLHFASSLHIISFISVLRCTFKSDSISTKFLPNPKR